MRPILFTYYREKILLKKQYQLIPYIKDPGLSEEYKSCIPDILIIWRTHSLEPKTKSVTVVRPHVFGRMEQCGKMFQLQNSTKLQSA